MNILKERPLVSGLVIGLVVGILFGWMVMGWVISPLKWVDANPELLREDFRSDYVRMTAALFSFTNNPVDAQGRMREWSGAAEYTCQLANDAPAGSLERQQLLSLAQTLSPGIDCENMTVAPTEETDQEEGESLLSRLALLCGVGLLALLVAGGAFWVIYRRGTRPETGEEDLPTEEPTFTLSDAAGRTIPLAQFPTEFNIGHDTYDDSFSIETATGEFLGECGVGISEAIGVGDPKKVTAFEVWLFDKNDIRTITKVIMSEHAYYDDALRAKLAPKGEAVLARPGETVVLETASLIINARIVEMEYGTGELPPQSFLNRLVVELAAWAKEGSEAPPEEEAPPADEFEL